MKTILALILLGVTPSWAEPAVKDFGYLTRGQLSIHAKSLYHDTIAESKSAQLFGCAKGSLSSSTDFENSFQLTDQKARQEPNGSYKCKNSHLVHTKTQGVDPIMRIYADNPEERASGVSGYGHNTADVTDAVMNTIKYKTYLKISFLKLMKGGNSLKLRLSILSTRFRSKEVWGWSADGSRYPMQYKQYGEDGYIPWEGNFNLDKCVTKDGQDVKDFKSKASSLSDILARENEEMMPGYVSCIYTSPMMTSADVGIWTASDKTIVPTLRNIKLQIFQNAASIWFQAYNGINYEAQNLPVVTSNDDKSVEAFTKAEELYDILKGALPIMASYPQAESLPHVVSYLTRVKPLLHAKMEELDVLLKAEDISFFTIFTITTNLNNFYMDLDKAVGIISQQQVRLGEVLELN